jgi:hypothetical protein
MSAQAVACAGTQAEADTQAGAHGYNQKVCPRLVRPPDPRGRRLEVPPSLLNQFRNKMVQTIVGC